MALPSVLAHSRRRVSRRLREVELLKYLDTSGTPLEAELVDTLHVGLLCERPLSLLPLL